MPPDDDLPLFGPMARRYDPDTSHQAAAAMRPKLGKIQKLVLDMYRRHGSMSARQAERLPELSEYGFSTIRKRISELAQAGMLESVGDEQRTGRTPATVYAIR